MSTMLHTLKQNTLFSSGSEDNHSIEHLESGQIIYLPHLYFKIKEQALFNPKICDGKKKNISYHTQKQTLGGISTDHPYRPALQTMMHNYGQFAYQLIVQLFPEYESALRWGRTSYRPVEIAGRIRSKRQDDTRVHVDAFPSSPTQGWRILRIFCNVNPNHQPRVWQVGTSFPEVLQHFSATLPSYTPYKAKLLHLLKITKSLRSAYDHYMLQLHDQMKLDETYQAHLVKTQIDFAANSTWIVFTDQVSHAALTGQYLLEQTFYLPLSAMIYPQHAPFNQLAQMRLI